MYKKIALTAHRDFPGKEDILQKIVTMAEAGGARILVDPERCDLPSLAAYKKYQHPDEADLLIAVGGDGTTLRAVRSLRNLAVPLLSINRGRVGFLAAFDAEECDAYLPDLLSGKGKVEERSLLSCRVTRGDTVIAEGRVLNEAVVGHGAIARLIELLVEVDGELLTTYRADGLIAATPTGSTAYALSAGGPILDPLLRATVLAPLNACNLGQKPVIISSERTITIRIQEKARSEHEDCIILTLDGQESVPLQRGDCMTITEYPERARFLRRKSYSAFGNIRRHLRWE